MQAFRDGAFTQERCADLVTHLMPGSDDPEELVETIHDLQRMIYDKGPVSLPIVSRFSTSLFWNFVKNFPTSLGTADDLINTWWLDGAPS